MDEQTELTPRNYQVALFKECTKGNTIIFMPTGAGKTFIAIMVLKKMGDDLIGKNHKVSIILVNTVALVDQHVKYVKQHTPFQCGGYSGEMNVDFWAPNVWQKEFEKNQVLVMTSEIFAGIVRGNIFNPNMVNLLIFDECHHAVNDHSMRILMKSFYDLRSPPKIIGLTATLLNGNCKPHRVLDEVRTLECTFKSKIATVDGLEVVVGYATNPMEYFLSFKSHYASQLEKECLTLIDSLMGVISLMKYDDKDDRFLDSNLKALEPVDDNKKLLNLMKDVKFHIEMFGIYGGKIACSVGNVLLRRFLFNCTDIKFTFAVKAIQTCFGEISNRFKQAMKDCKNEKERIYQFSSSKVLKMIEILRTFKDTSDEELCGLIFVERRSTAKVLHFVLNALSECDPQFNYIKSDFIVGNPNNLTTTLENLYISKKNREVLTNFVSKKTTLLCTSQVLEEGIDIPKCTFVCKFDIPKDYRSYIQSKGRARHKKSHYYMMVLDSEQQKFGARYKEYQEVEQTLNEFLIGKNDEREEPSAEELAEMNSNDLLKPFYVDGPGSAYIDPVSAISLLSRYCQTLQADRYTLYAPEWYYDHVAGGIQVTVFLPTKCPLVEPIRGIPMPNKKMAKRAAAYEACIQLYWMGELSNNLLPKHGTLKETDISFLFQHHPEKKEVNAGLKKARLHDLQIPKTISGKITGKKEVHLHILSLEPRFELDGLQRNFVSNLTYGFITPNPMPETCGFPLFLNSGTIEISVLNNVRAMLLTDDQIKAVKKFHFVVFNDVLEVVNEYFIMDHSDKAESLFLVPVRKDTLDIDFEVLEQNQDMVCFECRDDADKANLIVTKDTYLNKIVYPLYRNEVTVTNYLVLTVCEDKTPESAFPENTYDNFCDYYESKYNTPIVNKAQPLLYVKAISKQKKLYRPIGAEKKRKWDDSYTSDQPEYLVPEILGKREFPTELWIQARLLPCVLYRLTYMLRVETLWRKIGKECGFPLKDHDLRPLKVNLNLLHYKPSLEYKNKDIVMVKNCEEADRVEALPRALMSSTSESDANKIQSLEESRYPWKDLDEPKDIERVLDVTTLDIYAYCQFISKPVSEEQRKEVYSSPKKYYPALTYQKDFAYKNIQILSGTKSGTVELADMYEAMATAKASDIVNLERLEVLGDSFLKYITSHYIALRFPHFEEGRATQLKGRIISNKNLFYLAQKHNIAGIIRNKDLRLKNGWVPPGFCIPEKVRKDMCDKVVSWKILNSLDFTKEEMLSGSPQYHDFTVERNEFNEDCTDEAWNDIDHCLKKQYLMDKCVADSVEAIFGTYLFNTGMDGCLKVVQWMGVIPTSENLEELMNKPVPSPALRDDVTLLHIKSHLPLYQKIEEILGYTFKNKAFLLQAFTHASYTLNRVTPSYEKLEFLGDAILDFLITCFIFELCDDMTPGDLTDLRSALVNNNTFASFVVRLGLHKYLLLMNSKLQHYIDNFVDFFSIKKDFVIDDEILILLEEDEMNLAEYVDVPKALGDLFEAIAGAIFMDSNYSLETVWKVFYPIMWKEIDLFSANVPKNVVRRMYEMNGAYPEFGKAVETGSGSVMVRLNFLAEGRPKFVHGFGSNKKLAKKAAAKIALRNF